jgi:hypothetical protein
VEFKSTHRRFYEPVARGESAPDSSRPRSLTYVDADKGAANCAGERRRAYNWIVRAARAQSIGNVTQLGSSVRPTSLFSEGKNVTRVFLFLLGCILPGLGGALGSILGHRFGATGLWVGGIAGGLIASVVVAWAAAKAGWVPPARRTATAFGTAVGFLIAAAIAVRTLSSPVGPVLSTLLAGIGAIVGSRGLGSRSEA